MKYLLTLVCFLISTFLFGQHMTYSNWKEEAKSNIRLLPKYGNVAKTKAQQEADEELIKAYVEQEGTHRKASELLVKLGFNYLYGGDTKTAMYRFNQAWLLDAQNDNVYWGFGAVYFMFQDYDAAMKQYEAGLKVNPASSNILTDKATVYLTRYQSSNKLEDLQKALELFEQSFSVDPKNQNMLFKISVAYFLNNDCNKAWQFHNACKELGGNPFTKEYTATLTQNCK